MELLHLGNEPWRFSYMQSLYWVHFHIKNGPKEANHYQSILISEKYEGLQLGRILQPCTLPFSFYCIKHLFIINDLPKPAFQL